MSRRRFGLPASPPAVPSPGAFVMFPTTGLPAEVVEYQRALYEWAFAQAQAAVQPSVIERDLLGVWN